VISDQKLTRQTTHFRGVQNQTNRKTANRSNPNQNCIKLHLVWMYLDHLFTQPHGLVQFMAFILPTELNQTKPQYKKKKNQLNICHLDQYLFF